MVQYVFEALYTAQLVQKRKKWHDGRCTYTAGTKKLLLVDEEGRALAERFWSGDDVPEAGTTVQLDRYLVELDYLVRTVERSQTEAPAGTTPRRSPNRPIRAPKTTLGRPLSEVLQDASMQIKPLGSGPIERRVKRIKADKFGGLPPALVGRTEAGQPEPAARVKREINTFNASGHPSMTRPALAPVQAAALPGERAAKREIEPNLGLWDNLPGNSQILGHDESELFVEDFLDTVVSDDFDFALHDSKDTGVYSEAVQPPDAQVEPIEQVQTSEQTEAIGAQFVGQAKEAENVEQDRLDAADAADQAEQDSDNLFSDTEVEVLQIADAPRARRSVFEDMPDECPIEGPWTKEAYLLFSWHPPQPKVKQEVPV